MPVIALLAPRATADRVFAPYHFARLADLGTVVPALFTERADEVLDQLQDVEYLLSTWGMPVVHEAFLAKVPHLRGIFYAAGTVRGFATPALWVREIVVSSAALVNAIPVAEYTLGVILLANKRFWQHMGTTTRIPVPGNYKRTIGIIAASLVGRHVIRLLRSFDFDVLLYDPYVREDEAASLGARKVDLPELMAASDIVSLHAPNLPHLRHMINGPLLAQMQDGATFINTSRGALVDEAALLAEVATGRLYAILDVTEPEPPVADSPFFTLPQVIYTPHIAGSLDSECWRMADFAIDELTRHLAGEPLYNRITEEAMAYLA